MKSSMRKTIVSLTAGASAFAMAATATAADLSKEEQAIVAQIDKMFDQQVTFLEKIVNINSGSAHVAGVRKVGAVFEDEFSDLGFKNEWVSMPKEMQRAGHLFSEYKAGSGPKVMLVGHLDTIFPKESPYQTFSRDGDKAFGPGIKDMKDGDAIILYALKALKATGNMDRGTVRVYLTGDEESVGSPRTLARERMIEVGKDSDVAINFEGGRAGYGVLARRGSSGWQLEVKGRRSHSAGVFTEGVGAGAIFEASRILNGFYSYVRGEHGLTFNPGFIAGGTFADKQEDNSFRVFGKTNVVAQTVKVSGGLRFLNEEQKERARDNMRKIVAAHLPNTSAEITFTDGYPAMEESEPNRQLLEKFSQVSQDLGGEKIVAFDPTKRGAADISFVAPYTTTLDGLGAYGGGSHSPEEWVDLPSMKFATKRAAILVYRLLNEK